VRGTLHFYFFPASSEGDEWLLPCPAFGMDSDSSVFDIESMGLVAALSIPPAAPFAVGLAPEGIAGRLGSVVGADGVAAADAGCGVAWGVDDGVPSPLHAVSSVPRARLANAKRGWNMSLPDVGFARDQRRPTIGASRQRS